MSEQAIVDGLAFARSAQQMHGELPFALMDRLRSSLHGGASGSIEYWVRGGLDAQRRPILCIDIKGMLNLQCQRCLASLEYPLRLSNTLRLLQPGEDAGPESEDPGSADIVEAVPEMNVAVLIEDEILLGLPFAPRHPEGECPDTAGIMRHAADEASAFAKLAALRSN